MAYFPYGYNAYPYQSQYQAPTQQAMPQNSGIIRVQSEQEARNYPVAPGNSVTFIDENVPFFYSKTMGLSQLEPPVFEKYRIVKEEAQNSAQNAPETALPSQGIDLSAYALKSDIEAIQALYDDLNSKLEKLSEGA